MPITTTEALVQALFESGKVLCVSPESTWKTIDTVRVEGLEGGSWCISGERLLVKRIQRYLLAKEFQVKQTRQLRRELSLPPSFDHVRLHLMPGVIGGGVWSRTDTDFKGAWPRTIRPSKRTV